MRLMNGKSGNVLSAIIGGLIGAMVAGIGSYVAFAGQVSALRTDFALLSAEVKRLPYPWNAEESVRWRASVDSHISNNGIHQTPDEKAALIREVINAVLDERERRR